MIKRNIFLLTLLFLSVFPLNAQKLIRNTLITGVCYAGDKVNRIYIPLLKSFTGNAGMKGGAVSYYILFRILFCGSDSNGICRINTQISSA